VSLLGSRDDGATSPDILQWRRMTGPGDPQRGDQRRNARIYLLGLGVSLVGNNAMSLVAGIWVKTLTGSSAAAALVSVCVYAPCLLGPVGGVMADRYRSRVLLIVTYAASTVGVLALLFVRSSRDIWLIYLVMGSSGCSFVVSGPAESALFAQMFSPELRRHLNGISLSLQEAGRLIAPLAGAAIFALFGGGVVAAIDAVTFAVATYAVCLVRVHQPPPPRTAVHWRPDLTAGLGHIRATPQLRSIVVLSATAIAMSGIVVAAQYSLVAHLHRSPSFLGVLSGLLGAGSIAGSLTSGRIIGRIGEHKLASFGVVNYALGCGLRATGMLVPALVGAALLGFALPWCLIATITLGQRLTPTDLQGRVSAAISLALFAPQPITQAIGAGLIGHVGFRVLYAFAGTAPLVVLITPTMCHRAGRQLPPSIP
jgi:MFS family permease